jgi:hypothetical protein
MEDYIILKGRSGLEYYDKKGNGFFIDTELCAGSDYDYAVYIDSIVALKDNLPPSPKDILSIIERILFLCRERNMKPRIFHDNE